MLTEARMKSEWPDLSYEDVEGMGEGQYGSYHRAHVLGIYKLELDLRERFVSQRQQANSFFLGINTAVAALLSYTGFGVQQPFAVALIPLAIAGGILCLSWAHILKSYRHVNAARFRVARAIEQRLPARRKRWRPTRSYAAGIRVGRWLKPGT